MIVVPRVSQPSIEPTGEPAVRQTNQVSAEGMGANVGQALQGFGQTLGDIGHREEMRANVATLNQARIDLATDEANLFDPNNPDGVHAYKGKDAMQAPNVVRQNLDQFYQQYQAKLSNPQVRDEFGRMFAMHRLGVLDRTNNYALQQNDQYQQQAFAGAVGSALTTASEKALTGDADGSMNAQLDGVSAIKQYGQAQGWAPAFTQSKIDQFTQHVQQANEKGVVDRTEQMIAQDPQSAATLLGQRINIGQAAVVAQPVDPNAPAGIRNNNPTNLRAGDTAWQGKGAAANGYETFSTPLQGLRAGGINAVHLQDKGAQTVTQLITAWAPPNENDTQAYIADVSRQMGVSPTANVDLHNSDTLASFLGAVTQHENGQNPYTADQFKTAAMAALGKGKLPASYPPAAVHASGGMAVPADGTAQNATSAPQEGVGTDGMRMTGNYIVDSLKLGDAVQLYNRARAQSERHNVDLRTSLSQRVRDDTAAFENGQSVPQPLTQSDFNAAYPGEELKAFQAYDVYHSAQQFGQDLQTVATLTPQQMQDLLQARAPQPGLNYAAKSTEQAGLQRAMQQTLKARVKDPVQWVQQAAAAKLAPIDLSSSDKLAQSIAARVAPMHTASQTYRMPYRLLTHTEQDALSQVLGGMPATQKAAALGAMASDLDTNDYQQVLTSIKANSPVAARAGEVMAAGHAVQIGSNGSWWWKTPTDMSADDVAQTMLTGEALINPSKADEQANGKQKFAMPPDSGALGMRTEFANVAGDAFRGDGAGAVQAYQAYRAMYAGLAAKAGVVDGTYDADIATEAAKAALGNVVKWGDHNVIPPYGMDEAAFTDTVNTQWAKLRTGLPGQEDTEASAYTLDRLGNSTNAYAVSENGAPVRDKAGKPVVIRVNYPGAIRYIAPPPASSSGPPTPQQNATPTPARPAQTPAPPTLAGTQ